MHSSPSRRVHVYLNVSSRNMVTFSFCIFSNVVFFAYIMWNETLHIYLRWSPCIMVTLSDESFQSKQFNIIKSPSTQIAIIKTWALWLNKELLHYCHVAIIIVPSVFYLLLHLFFSTSPRRRLAIHTLDLPPTLMTCTSSPLWNIVQTGIHTIVAYRRSTMSTQRIKKSSGVSNAVMWDRNVSVFLEKSNWKAIALITSTRCKYARWLYNDECPVYTVYGLLF
jgi:hypothetical protein